METIDIKAASVEEAQQQAVERLGVDLDSLEIEVIEQRSGLFGRGEVVVRATVKPGAKRAEPELEEEVAVVEVQPEDDGGGADEEDLESAEDDEEDDDLAESTSGADEDDKDEVDDDDDDDDDDEEEDGDEEEESSSDEDDDEEQEEPVATPEHADTLKALFEELLQLADLDVEITDVNTNGRYVNLEVDGDDVRFLIGRQGEVLNAVQYLLNVISARQIGEGIRVTLEGGSFRRKREKQLTKLARDVAKEVARRGEEAVLTALPAFERRIVHKVLSDFEGIITYSEGVEPNRQVVIAPSGDEEEDDDE